MAVARDGGDAQGRRYQEVVLGPRSSGALIGCSLEIRPNSYDHMRQKSMQLSQFAGQRVKVKLPMWDFALHRDDGTGVRLHPHWSNRKVAALAPSCPTRTRCSHRARAWAGATGQERSAGTRNWV